MRFVERCEMRPLHCAIFPHLGARHPRGYIETGSRVGLTEESIYLSVEGIEQVAAQNAQVDLVRGSEHREALKTIADLEREVSLLQDQLADADKFAEAAEYTLGRFGQHVRNKPGRKPSKSAQEA